MVLFLFDVVQKETVPFFIPVTSLSLNFIISMYIADKLQLIEDNKLEKYYTDLWNYVLDMMEKDTSKFKLYSEFSNYIALQANDNGLISKFCSLLKRDQKKSLSKENLPGTSTIIIFDTQFIPGSKLFNSIIE